MNHTDTRKTNAPRNFVCARCKGVRATGGFYTPWACPAAKGAVCVEALPAAEVSR